MGLTDSLTEKYNKWEAFRDSEDGQKLKGLKFSLGKPLTEEEFKRHRESHKTEVVKKIVK